MIENLQEIYHLSDASRCGSLKQQYWAKRMIGNFQEIIKSCLEVCGSLNGKSSEDTESKYSKLRK